MSGRPGFRLIARVDPFQAHPDPFGGRVVVQGWLAHDTRGCAFDLMRGMVDVLHDRATGLDFEIPLADILGDEIALLRRIGDETMKRAGYLPAEEDPHAFLLGAGWAERITREHVQRLRNFFPDPQAPPPLLDTHALLMLFDGLPCFYREAADWQVWLEPLRCVTRATKHECERAREIVAAARAREA